MSGMDNCAKSDTRFVVEVDGSSVNKAGSAIDNTCTSVSGICVNCGGESGPALDKEMKEYFVETSDFLVCGGRSC